MIPEGPYCPIVRIHCRDRGQRWQTLAKYPGSIHQPYPGTVDTRLILSAPHAYEANPLAAGITVSL